LTKLLDKWDDPSHPGFFEWLNYVIKNWMWWFDSGNISLADPINWGYTVKINEKYTGNDRLFFKVDGEWKVSITDSNFHPVSAYYYNFGKDNYYQVSSNWKELNIWKNKKPGENPEITLPNYSWDAIATNLLKKWILVDRSGNNLKYYDAEWNLVSSIPCEKDTDWTYKLKEGYSTKLNTLKLYRYEWNNTLTS
jgi:hypothetical protein